MTEKKENKIKIEDLPEAEKELSAEEAKNVKGGVSFNYAKIEFKAGDGSVRPGAVDPPEPDRSKPGA